MRRWRYYLQLAFLDFARLWASTQHHVIIVAGIVLPILLLLGLKRGHVAELRSELLRSPTGRQVTFWSGQQGELMQADSIDRLSRELPGVEIIIPDVERIVQVAPVRDAPPETDGANDSDRHEQSVTLFATRVGDPVLQQAGCAIQSDAIDEIVLAESVAEQLSVTVGDKCRLTVRRRADGSDETADTIVSISSILGQGAAPNAIGFAHFDLLDQFEQWIRGYGAPRLGWHPSKTPVPPRYCEYLVFTEGVSGLPEDDKRAFSDRGFDVLEATNPLETGLAGLLKEDARSGLSVHKLRPTGSTSERRTFLNMSGTELEMVTHVDDVIIPWNPPLPVAGGETVLVGVTLKKRSWLRNYLKAWDTAFEPAVDSAIFVSRDDSLRRMEVPLRGGVSITVTEKERDESDRRPESLTPRGMGGEGNHVALVVPVPFLARVWAYERGEAAYDPVQDIFTPVAQPSVYGKARLFSKSIDDVPAVVSALLERSFQVTSESGRISEIHDQDSSLQLLVFVVGTGVFLFGLITVFSVLVDSTDRKRGVIGILRVMGVTRGGIFCLVLVRAVAIGLLAGLVATIAGLGVQQILGWCPPVGASWLSWKPCVTLLISSSDILAVIMGSVACAAVGAVFPAWKASQMDPFEAILEGRFV